METRARYALIGVFMLAVIVAGFAFVYWLNNSGGIGARTSYEIRFQSSVSGLLVGSAVLFNGIRVGEVTELHLDAKNPSNVVATIGVVPGTPIRADTDVSVETQGLTGGAVISLRGGSGDAPLPTGKNGAPPQLVAEPTAGQDWTQAARDAFQQMNALISDNSDAVHSLITNIDTFAGALARNSDKVEGILAGVEKLTGGSSKGAAPLYDLAAVTDVPPVKEAPSWQVAVPEPSSLMGFNTDKIQMQPAPGQSVAIANAQWSDNLPVLVQEKVLQSFENAGYARSVSRPRDGLQAPFQLLIDIRSFQIVGSDQPKASVKYMVKIANADGKVLDAREFAGEAPAKSTDASDAAAALNEAFDQTVKDLIPWTASTVSAAPPPPPPAQDAAPPAPPAPDEAAPAAPGDAAPSAPGDATPPPPPPAPPAPDSPT